MRTTALSLMIGCGLACGAAWGPTAAPPSKSIPVPNMPVLTTTTLDGGVIIEDMKLGNGYEVKPDDIVVAHYALALKASPTEVFDSTYKRGEPAGFPLANVIPGWRMGMPGMKVGGIRRLTVPAVSAYGEISPSPDIPANSDLVFIIELVDVMQVDDLKVGVGETATGRWVAVTAHTITNKDGKVIEKRDAINPYIWVRGEYQPMALGLEGMKQGGKRKIAVPAALNRTDPRFGTERLENVPVIIEVELLNLKLVPPDADAPGC